MRAAALYEHKHESYLERLEPLKEELDDKAMQYFFNEDVKPENMLGDNE